MGLGEEGEEYVGAGEGVGFVYVSKQLGRYFFFFMCESFGYFLGVVVGLGEEGGMWGQEKGLDLFMMFFWGGDFLFVLIFVCFFGGGS